MADPDETPATVRCAACGFENAPSSVYCQDCGARLVVESPPVPPGATPLPAAAAPAQSPSAPAPTASKKPRTPPARRLPRLGELIGITLRTLLFAALVAGAIQMLRPPRALPPPAKAFSDEVITNARALAQHTEQTGGPFDAPWASVNSYLAAVLPPSSSFARASIVPRAGGFLLIVERRALGLPVFLSTEYRVVTRGNGIDLDPAGAAIGRVPLPPWMAGFVEILDGGLYRALFTEITVLRNAKSAQISQDRIRFIFIAPAP
jgi:hypothetical protein